MAANQYIEYFDPLTSMGVNHSRRGFLPFGRYYGFDTWNGTSNVLEHSADSLMHYSDNLNVDQTAAVFVTKHGVTIFTSATSTPLTLTPVANEFQVVFVDYIWADTPGPIGFTWGTLANVAVEPTDPKAVGSSPTETPIGYFSYDGVGAETWVPYPKPSLAGKELDDTLFAKLDRTNIFTRANVPGSVVATETNLVADPNYAAGSQYYTLDVATDCNVIFVMVDIGWVTANGLPLIISDINMPTKADAQPLQIYIQEMPAGARLVSNGVGFRLSTGDGTNYTPAEAYRIFSFISRAGVWIQETGLESTNEIIRAQGSLIAQNVQQILANQNAIGQLQAPLAWTDVITPGTEVDAKWKVNTFQTAVDKDGNSHVRGSFTALGTVSAADQSLGTYAVGFSFASPIGSLTVSTPTIFYTDSGNDTIHLNHPAVILNDTFILPDTIATLL